MTTKRVQSQCDEIYAFLTGPRVSISKGVTVQDIVIEVDRCATGEWNAVMSDMRSTSYTRRRSHAWFKKLYQLIHRRIKKLEEDGLVFDCGTNWLNVKLWTADKKFHEKALRRIERHKAKKEEKERAERREREKLAVVSDFVQERLGYSKKKSYRFLRWVKRGGYDIEDILKFS